MHSAALLLEMAPSKNMIVTSKRARGATPKIGTLVRQILRSNQEHKVYSTQVAGAIANTAGAIVSLSTGIIEGADINQRSGTTIRAIKMHFRFTFQFNVGDQSLRFLIFRDMFNVGTTPTPTEILPTTGYLSHFSDVRMIQQKRYQILYDKTVDVSINGPSRVTRRVDLNLNKVINYNGSTAIATANGHGGIFMCVIGSANTGIYDYDWQLVYTDS